jgi:hypothetical protein
MSERLSGGCRCGAVRYEVSAIVRNSICHCRDCQRSSGAPMVEWMLVDEDALTTAGEAATFESSPGTLRSFCPACGTGLFYRNAAVFPGQVDVQTATLDQPERAPLPAAQVQVAEARNWVTELAAIHAFERYPGM